MKVLHGKSSRFPFDEEFGDRKVSEDWEFGIHANDLAYVNNRCCNKVHRHERE